MCEFIHILFVTGKYAMFGPGGNGRSAQMFNPFDQHLWPGVAHDRG